MEPWKTPVQCEPPLIYSDVKIFEWEKVQDFLIKTGWGNPYGRGAQNVCTLQPDLMGHFYDKTILHVTQQLYLTPNLYHRKNIERSWMSDAAVTAIAKNSKTIKEIKQEDKFLARD